MDIVSVWFICVSMTDPVKIFQTAQNYMKIIGIYPPRPGQSHTFNTKNICYLVCLVNVFILVTLFFLFQAKSAVEFSISFYCSITSLTVFSLSTINIYKTANIFKVVEAIEKFIEKSKCSIGASQNISKNINPHFRDTRLWVKNFIQKIDQQYWSSVEVRLFGLNKGHSSCQYDTSAIVNSFQLLHSK